MADDEATIKRELAGMTGSHGNLNVKVFYDKPSNTVVINFGTSISWMALSPEEAQVFTDIVLRYANEGRLN